MNFDFPVWKHGSCIRADTLDRDVVHPTAREIAVIEMEGRLVSSCFLAAPNAPELAPAFRAEIRNCRDPMTPQRFNILLIDDAPESARLFEMTLRDVAPGASLYWVATGHEGLEALERRNRFIDVAGIDVVVLDLNMSPVDGFEVLDRIRGSSDEKVSTKPVIVMSSSSHDSDITKAYRCGATSYIVKPVSLEALHDIVGLLTRYWLDVVALPRE